MYLFVIPLLFTYTTAIGYNSFYRPKSAASEAQIKFAIENKYDDTGPGAKTPESAYNTYKTLEDALIGYLDDPDTKLPEHEKSIAIQNLLLTNGYPKKENHFFPEISNFDKSYLSSGFNEPNKSVWKTELPKHKQIKGLKDTPFQLRVKHPLNLGHYFSEKSDGGFRPSSHPKYSYSYNIHDIKTGDQKMAQEIRDGGNVIGFYSFKDADGKTRTVQYTANGKEGFKATVRKTDGGNVFLD